MITIREKKRLVSYIKERFDEKHLDYKTFDIESEIDESLSYNENKGIIDSKLSVILPLKTENITKKEATIMPKAQHEELVIQELKRVEKQAELEFSKTLEKIEKDNTTQFIEDIYFLPKQYAKMVAKGNARGFILFGNCGIGKSYCIMRAFREEKVDFKYLSGHITSLELYQFLYEHRKEHIILDDVNILDSENNLNMLKACLNDNSRIVSYHTSSSKLKVPNMFNFEGTITLLLNALPKSVESLKAVESRVLNYELKMDYHTKMKVIFELSKKEYVGLSQEERLEIAKWLKENTSEATENLNLRLLFMLFETYKFDKENWKKLGNALIKTDEHKQLIIQGLNERAWCEATGRHRATYYRYKKEIFGIAN